MSNLIDRQAALDAIKKLEKPAPTAQHLSAIFDCEDTIKALPSAQPMVISKSENTTECEDAVSRADVDILIEEAQTAWLRGDILLMYPALKKGLQKVPPVIPKQPGWIPVTERLPERYDNYLITTEDEDTDIGTFHPEFKQWSICDADGFRLTDGVLAWCELPTPYREGGQDGKN